MSGYLVGRVYYIQLSHPEQAVMIALAERGGDDGDRIFPSIAEVAWRTGYSERQVQRILRTLEDKKLIESVQYTSGGRGKIPGYQMHLENGTLKPPCPRPGRNLDPNARPVKGDTVTSPFNQPQKGDTVTSPFNPVKGDIFDVKGDIFDVKGDIFDVKGDISHAENAPRAASHADSVAGTYITNREPKEKHTDAHAREVFLSHQKQKAETEAEAERPHSQPAPLPQPPALETSAPDADPTPPPAPPPLAPAPPLTVYQVFTAWLAGAGYTEVPGQRMTPVEKRIYEDAQYHRYTHLEVLAAFQKHRNSEELVP